MTPICFCMPGSVVSSGWLGAEERARSLARLPRRRGFLTPIGSYDWLKRKLCFCRVPGVNGEHSVWEVICWRCLWLLHHWICLLCFDLLFHWVCPYAGYGLLLDTGCAGLFSLMLWECFILNKNFQFPIKEGVGRYIISPAVPTSDFPGSISFEV